MRPHRPLSSRLIGTAAALLITAGGAMTAIADREGAKVPALAHLLLVIVLLALFLSVAARFAGRLSFLLLAAAGTALSLVALSRPLEPEFLRPLPLVPASASSAFHPDQIPDAPGLDGLPAWGNGFHPGEFRSAPLQSGAALLQIRILGTLHPPETEIHLQSLPSSEAAAHRPEAAGEISAPLEAQVAAPARWHRLNFHVPQGPFQLVVRSTGPPLAFSAPIEIPFSAWLAGKSLRAATAILVLGLALALFAVILEAPALNERCAALGRPEASAARSAFSWVLLAGYGVFFAFHTDTTAGPNDSGGYLNSAKLIAHGAVTAAPRWPLPRAEALRFSPDLSAYTPGTFLPTPDGRLAPQYPSGFPLIVAAVGQLLPLSAAVPAVIVLQLVLGVLATYGLARACRLPPLWALFAAAVIALSPVYLFQGLQPQSDGPALLWVTTAVLLALRAREAASPVPALLCGLVAAMAVLIRPSNTLALLPLLLCLLTVSRPRALLAFVLGGLPGAAFLLWYNHRLYGHAFTTGYGSAADVGTGFGLRFLRPTLSAYAGWLPAFFTPLVWLAPAAPFVRALPGHVRGVLTVWVGLYAAFFAVYWCTYDNWYNMRFLLPAAPGLVVLALWTARALLARRPLPPLVVAAAALLLLGLLVRRGARERVLYWMTANRVHADAARYAAAHLPPDAVVFAKPAAGTLIYYSPFPVVRSDSAAARDPAFYAALTREHHPLFALTYHWEQKDFHWGGGKGTGYPDLPGAWRPVAVIGDREMYLWQRE